VAPPAAGAPPLFEEPDELLVEPATVLDEPALDELPPLVVPAPPGLSLVLLPQPVKAPTPNKKIPNRCMMDPPRVGNFAHDVNELENGASGWCTDHS